ncbi:MAG: hypothetical protein JGK17_23835 [Microcoleus sp. PH2017_10_PVI_O_A]|uniref:hypothetical protein n=1 Tax=unclassified Microcoleus TaxID=2642155 RepID=UPI001DB7EF2B|nr:MULTISPECIES: hypothetical protein [unclassified Microcoleus]TAE78991.1 MAG: hypothetical protein EAZ83_23255 [Oscillatoriales cyanobacterium]MCC3408558.1 hypothetical protein [Microcoleus sp. PH2017_10_PVI_O_A]MCC3462648.1 hypothetical protein [Microcoleus sp. PH2017_11_PCY_U_A]MCC3481072.1 hypothetical protein [Microcoleus sp. PH2017_12_PCY_D_A]MCC3527470.1 hypothetical protein [Microcoleus sp. PH2017_21_RUC_O_A]
MTDFNSSDNNTVEQKGIDIEIWEPAFIVISVPKNSTNATTFIQIHLAITNNTSTLSPFINKYLTPNFLLLTVKKYALKKRGIDQ